MGSTQVSRRGGGGEETEGGEESARVETKRTEWGIAPKKEWRFRSATDAGEIANAVI